MGASIVGRRQGGAGGPVRRVRTTPPLLAFAGRSTVDGRQRTTGQRDDSTLCECQDPVAPGRACRDAARPNYRIRAAKSASHRHKPGAPWLCSHELPVRSCRGQTVSAVCRLLEELSREGNARRVPRWWPGFGDVVTTEVFQALDFLPRQTILGRVLAGALGVPCWVRLRPTSSKPRSPSYPGTLPTPTPLPA